MANVNLPFPVEGKNDKETIQNLFDVVIRLRKELEFLLYNLDEENVLKAKYAEIANLVAGNISADQITTGTLDADLINVINLDATNIVSNTTIVNNLYAQYGRIANLSVSELDTAWQKIQNYLDSNTSDVRYQRIYEDKKEVIIASVSGFSDAYSFSAATINDTQINLAWTTPTSLGVVQMQDRALNNLFWTDDTHTGMTITETEETEPVYTYAYTEVTKRLDATDVIDNEYLPYVLEGAGDGVTLMSGKVKRQKKTDGYYQTYYKRTSGDEVIIALTDNGIVGCNKGATADRPTGVESGYQYFDTDIGIPIWNNGTNWINASGTTV